MTPALDLAVVGLVIVGATIFAVGVVTIVDAVRLALWNRRQRQSHTWPSRQRRQR